MTGDRRLFDLDDHRDFVEVVYRVVLGREADAEGLDFYVGELEGRRLGRQDVFEQLLFSEEGRTRTRQKYPHEAILEGFVQVYPPDPFGPFVSERPVPDAPLCECADPRRWLNDEWRGVLGELGLSAAPQQMHRKGFEWAQTLFGLRHLGMLRDDARCLGVGSGHETILYWLANRVGEVVATDLYEGDWASRGALEGDPDVLMDPHKYAPFPYRAERLRFLRMDGRQLEFDDDSFDVVFSLSSIEHFGGNEGAARAMREKARVCRHGGVVVVATDLILNDRQHEEFFTIEELREHVVAASGMKLVQEPRFEVPAHALAYPCRMPEEGHRYPHLVLDTGGVITSSVILFLRHD